MSDGAATVHHMRRPETEAEVLAAAAAGEIAESPYLDVKRELDSNNRETAKDIASFAIDGGSILIGLDEDQQGRRFTPSPIVLAGIAEKLEQVAENRIDPPLPIRVYDIPTAEDPTRGYVWMEIPASDAAPHMVGGIYYARNDRTTRRLSDAEVVRLHRARASDVDVAAAALDALEQADGTPYGASNRHGRLYVVAQPLSGSPSLAEELVWSDASAVKRIASNGHLPDEMQFEPRPDSFSQSAARPDGQAVIAPSYGAPDHPRDARYSYEVLFRMDGGIRVTCGRMTDEMASRMGGDSEEVVLDVVAVGYADLISQWAAQVAEQTGYRGAWALGVHATGLRGRFSYRVMQQMFGFRAEAATYPESSFRHTVRASTKELTESPEAVAYRLTRRMLRSLGTDSYFREQLGL